MISDIEDTLPLISQTRKGDSYVSEWEDIVTIKSDVGKITPSDYSDVINKLCEGNSKKTFQQDVVSFYGNFVRFLETYVREIDQRVLFCLFRLRGLMFSKSRKEDVAIILDVLRGLCCSKDFERSVKGRSIYYEGSLSSKSYETSPKPNHRSESVKSILKAPVSNIPQTLDTNKNRYSVFQSNDLYGFASINNNKTTLKSDFNQIESVKNSNHSSNIDPSLSFKNSSRDLFSTSNEPKFNSSISNSPKETFYTSSFRDSLTNNSSKSKETSSSLLNETEKLSSRNPISTTIDTKNGSKVQQSPKETNNPSSLRDSSTNNSFRSKETSSSLSNETEKHSSRNPISTTINTKNGSKVQQSPKETNYISSLRDSSTNNSSKSKETSSSLLNETEKHSHNYFPTNSSPKIIKDEIIVQHRSAIQMTSQTKITDEHQINKKSQINKNDIPSSPHMSSRSSSVKPPSNEHRSTKTHSNTESASKQLPVSMSYRFPK